MNYILYFIYVGICCAMGIFTSYSGYNCKNWQTWFLIGAVVLSFICGYGRGILR